MHQLHRAHNQHHVKNNWFKQRQIYQIPLSTGNVPE